MAKKMTCGVDAERGADETAGTGVLTTDDLTIRQMILLVAVALSRETDPFSTDDLVVACWLTYPDTFCLRGYRNKHPDSNKVVAKLAGDDGLCGKNYRWLERTDQPRILRTTRLGRSVAIGLQKSLDLLPVCSGDDPIRSFEDAVPDSAPKPAVVKHPVTAGGELLKRRTRHCSICGHAGHDARKCGDEPKATPVAPKSPVPVSVPVSDISAQEVLAINAIAKCDALRKFLCGSVIAFTDACAF